MGIPKLIQLFRRFKARRTALVVMVVIAGLVGWHFVRPMVISDATVTGTAEPVQSRIVINNLIYTCDIQSNREKAYRQSSSGTIAKQGAKLGDHVEAGQFLAQVDSNTIIEDRAQTMEAYSKLQRDVEAKKKLLVAARKLYERDLGSQQAVVDARSAFQTSVDALAQIKRRLANSSNAVKSLTLTAQFSGYITDQMAFVGDAVGADQVIFVESDLDNLYGRFFVSNKYKNKIRSGVPVAFYDPYKKTKICDGQISYIGKFAAQKGILIEATFKPESPSQALDYYKQQVEVRVKVGQSDLAVPSVPLSAVYFDSEGPYVFEIHRGVTQKTRVKLGFIGSEYAEIQTANPITNPVLVSSDTVPRAGQSFKSSDNAHDH